MSDQVSSLFSLAHSLLTLGQDGSPIYVDSFTRLNRDVYESSPVLLKMHSEPHFLKHPILLMPQYEILERCQDNQNQGSQKKQQFL